MQVDLYSGRKMVVVVFLIGICIRPNSWNSYSYLTEQCQPPSQYSSTKQSQHCTYFSAAEGSSCSGETSNCSPSCA